MKDRYKIPKLLFLSLLMLFFIMGCSSGADDDETVPDDTQGAASLSIGVSASSVKSDDSNSVTVTATVLDGDNASVEGVTVRFTTTSGALSAASATTDASGAAEVSFHSGLVDQSNRVATITATLGGLTAQVPVQVVGTTVSVTQESTTLTASDATDNLEIYVTDASGDGIYNAEVSITVANSSTGSVSLSADTGNTGVDGTLSVTVTGARSGPVTLNISAAGAITSCDYTVSTTTGNILEITSPTSDPAHLEIGDSLTVTVSDPDRGQVVLSTTLGTLNGSGSAVTLDASSGTASATLTTTTAGIATVQAYNTDAPSVTDSISVAMYAPASDAAAIAIQASSTVVAPSTADLVNSVEISAWVTDASGNPVGEAPVVFSMANTPGGGERLSPTVAFTDASGYATSIFYSGSLSSDAEGVTVTAQLLADDSINDSLKVIIGGTSGSVVVGASTTIESINDDTAYRLPVSVLVADTNGSPVPGAIVTINVWPLYYYTGDAWYGGPYGGPYDNEDVNRDLVLDVGEDANNDGELTPVNSSAGNMPATVVVDENGLGTVDWVYLKIYAGYIGAEIRCSTEVYGSQTTSTTVITLKALIDPDIEDGLLGPSPFLWSPVNPKP